MGFEKRAVNFREIMFKDGEVFSGIYFEYYENGLVSMSVLIEMV